MKNIDHALLERLLKYRGMSESKLCKLAGLHPSYLNGVKHGATQQPSLHHMAKISEVLQVPLDAFLNLPAIAQGKGRGWHVLDMTKPDLLTTMLEEMTATNEILSVTTCMENHLTPKEMSLETSAEKYQTLDKVRYELRMHHVKDVIELRKKLRDRLNYELRIVVPDGAVVWIPRKNPEWIREIEGEMKKHKLRTAIGFIPMAGWMKFYNILRCMLPIFSWDYINISGKVIACVWSGTDVIYSYCPDVVIPLLHKIEENIKLWVPYPFPEWGEHGLQAFRNCNDGAHNYLKHFLR